MSKAVVFPGLYLDLHQSVQISKQKVMKDLGESVFTLNSFVLEYND